MRTGRPILSAVLLALLAACASAERGSADSTATASSLTTVSSAGAPAAAPSIAPADSISNDPWVASADSALRRLLPGDFFGADSASTVDAHECDFDGDDAQMMLMAAVRARVIGHGTVGSDVDMTSKEGEYRAVAFDVEITSVAQLTPAWDAGVRDFHGVPADEAWAATVAVRTDTLSLRVRDYGTPQRRWAVCDFGGSVQGATTNYWQLLSRQPKWATIVRWNPAGSSWVRVKALADSVRLATYWPPTVVVPPHPTAQLVASRDSTPRDPWVATADSVLREALPGSLFGGNPDAVVGFRDCLNDGGDSPPMLMAAVRARPIGHDTVTTGLDDDDPAAKEVAFHVELTSVAQFTYAPDAGLPIANLPGSATENREVYVAVVGPRVDTLDIGVRDYATRTRRWALCNIGGRVRGDVHIWMLLDREPPWVKVVRWTPPSASWERVRALADSVRHATR